MENMWTKQRQKEEWGIGTNEQKEAIKKGKKKKKLHHVVFSPVENWGIPKFRDKPQIYLKLIIASYLVTIINHF